MEISLIVGNRSLSVIYPITIEDLYSIHMGYNSEEQILIKIAPDDFFYLFNSLAYKERENWDDDRDIWISTVEVYCASDENHYLHGSEL